jgi:hypothetical protein
MPTKTIRWHYQYPASYLPKDSSTRMAGRAKRDSSVPIRIQPQHAVTEIKAHFGNFSFQAESAISLYLVRFTNKNCDLYLIGLMRIFYEV